jgi:hypothetical protein
MAFAAGALGTATGVMNGALEQRAAEDTAKVRESGGVSVPAANGLRAFNDDTSDTTNCQTFLAVNVVDGGD